MERYLVKHRDFSFHFLTLFINSTKMEVLRTSEVGTTLVPFSVGSCKLRVKLYWMSQTDRSDVASSSSCRIVTVTTAARGLLKDRQGQDSNLCLSPKVDRNNGNGSK